MAAVVVAVTPFEIVKSAYPGIPDAILSQYLELLPLVAMNGDLNNSAQEYFKQIVSVNPDWGNAYSAARNMIVAQLLYPENQQQIKKNAFRWQAYPLDNGAFFFDIGGELIFDKRLFVGIKNDPYAADLQKALTVVAAKYNGLESLIALHENGYSMPEINFEKAYALMTYINAYKKFSTEIDAERAYLQREAEAQLASYRQDYTDRAQREKSDLQSKKIQMLMAIDNDTKAATRDFQNMLLSAQNLKQNLRGQIG